MRISVSVAVTLVLYAEAATAKKGNLRGLTGLGGTRCFRNDQCPGMLNVCKNSYCTIPPSPPSLIAREGDGRPAFGTCSTDADCPTLMCVTYPCPANLCDVATNTCYLEGTEASEDNDIGDTPESFSDIPFLDREDMNEEPVLIMDPESNANATAGDDTNTTDRFDDIMFDDPILVSSPEADTTNATSLSVPMGFGAFLADLTPCGSSTCTRGFVCCSEESEICASSEDACPDEEEEEEEEEELEESALNSKTVNVTTPSVPVGFEVEDDDSVSWLPRIYQGDCGCISDECLLCYHASLLGRCVEIGCPTV